ncbi:non-hydrolyzing UDP-N-acetylglucosamine 2-epimerase [Desulfohalovibrio reitneri]|uniref:non-hydrolyzing UDP-N-acetylglucosamine 2-epimerase n=1 Tax=Desulfohalovibrio reitneri TaxID=1307759 RepID=UPI0004A72613|nr:UDP-N-acetylglucosamine 2-epimerase (non-hydrolyzing) [Desulfohalovibrio reitneri]
MSVLTVVGARPQFIKAAPVRAALARAGVAERLVHTGQHYDHAMSQVFFDELDIPPAEANLAVGSGGHGEQTGRMLALLESEMQAHRPGAVLVYGDTNSTLAGALAAAKLRIPVAHVEAGLRSFNRDMPEEINRVLTDHCSDLLFCPTDAAVANLRAEGVTGGVHQVGDTMYDVVLAFEKRAREKSTILKRLGLEEKGYLAATLHRPANVDDPKRLRAALAALAGCGRPVVLPVHPRTRARMEALPGWDPEGWGDLRFVDPLGYLDMLRLVSGAAKLVTDSGGLQKEAYFLGVPCVTVREETEWVETVEAGWNTLAGAAPDRLARAVAEFEPSGERPALYGRGDAADRIADILKTTLAA